MATDRRLFLRSALAAGGLLVPWRGNGALALPDVPALARLPVTPQPLPVPAECLALRQLKRELAACHAMPHSQVRDAEWFGLFIDYRARAHVVAGAPATSWSDVVAVAEIAWHISPKEEIETADGRREYTGRLAVGRPGFCGHPHLIADGWSNQVLATLIEGVLALGEGERFDPKMGESLRRA